MKPKRIYTYGGRPARRNLTVADLVALKGGARLCQTCPATEEEAAACEAAGIDVLNTSDADLPAVRAGAPANEHEKLLEALESRRILSP